MRRLLAKSAQIIGHFIAPSNRLLETMAADTMERGGFIVHTTRLPHADAQVLNVQKLAFIYQDDTLLVLDKAAGMLAVPGRGVDKQDCLATRVQAEFPDALVVHRLDMATSGLILFARGAVMQSRLSQMFREREVDKNYVAVVAGKLESACGEIDLPLSRDWPNRPKQRVNFAEGKSALTRYRLLSIDEEKNSSRIELEPVTGRTHQLRVHLAAIAHPILGDALYGDASGAPRLLLHACRLSFVHPMKGELLTCTSEAKF
jgi:tRNA pseudouridine32 synthase/23S rRNA pseudouridine746 synthase